MEKKTMLKLSLKKETITKLNDDQLKQFVGGAAELPTQATCEENSCNSNGTAPTCISTSCNNCIPSVTYKCL